MGYFSLAQCSAAHRSVAQFSVAQCSFDLLGQVQCSVAQCGVAQGSVDH